LQIIDIPKPSLLFTTGIFDVFVNGKDINNYLVVDDSNR
jgi:hypothetical protein